MAITLNDYAKQARKSGDAISAMFIEDLLRESDIMGMLTFKPISALKAHGTRWQTLPSAAFRKIGAGYTESTGRTENIEETLHVLGGDIQYDRVFEHVGDTVEDPVITQSKMKARAIARVFNDFFINGDLAVNADGFEGLKKRVSNMPARMTINIDDDGDGTGDVLNVLASAANEHTFIDAIHKAKKYVSSTGAGSLATKIICNEATWLGIGQVARRLNLYQSLTDALGKTWDTIAGIPFVDIGLQSDLATEIITTTEDPGDGGADSTSMYVVCFDSEYGLSGIQLKGTSPALYDPLNGGEQESQPTKLRRCDWPVGLYNLSQFCIARVKGFAIIA